MPNKKAAVYDPYLDTLGGGERYCLTVAETLLKNGYDVDLFWSGDSDLLNKAQYRFCLDISNLRIVPDIFNLRTPHLTKNIISSVFQKFKITSSYDLFFYLSNGSVPLLFSKNNYLHVQVPFSTAPSSISRFSNRLKLSNFKDIVVNSYFTQMYSQFIYQRHCTVLYPPVDVSSFYSSKKEKIILSVGRFDNILNSKRQDVLINAFKELSPQIPGWKLVLTGGSLTSENHNLYLTHLKDISQKFPIEFIVNPGFKELTQIYASASVYWHAAGFGVDQEIHPENTEHFGMTIVEAMASSVVPVVINKGGIPEIITTTHDGFLWNTTDELIKYTRFLIDNPDTLLSMSQAAQNRSQSFSKENFQKSLLKLIK